MDERSGSDEKEFRLWKLLAWLLGTVLTLMLIAAIVNLAVLGW